MTDYDNYDHDDPSDTYPGPTPHLAQESMWMRIDTVRFDMLWATVMQTGEAIWVPPSFSTTLKLGTQFLGIVVQDHNYSRRRLVRVIEVSPATQRDENPVDEEVEKRIDDAVNHALSTDREQRRKAQAYRADIAKDLVAARRAVHSAMALIDDRLVASVLSGVAPNTLGVLEQVRLMAVALKNLGYLNADDLR